MNEIEILKTENQKLINTNINLKQIAKEQKAIILNEEHRFEIRFTKLLSDLFSPTQIDLILHPKKKVYKWLPSDIASAISLRSISPRTYTFLRETKKFPLPGLSTLRQWATTFELNPGILNNVLQLMKAKGLFANWKQPVFYDFDVQMKPELLFKIIHQLYNVGYNVIAIVNDMGATNMEFVGKNILIELIKINNGNDYRIAHKLGERHLLVEGTSRMNVKIAAQATKLIQLFNDWFDLHNSSHKYDHERPSFGLNIENQKNILLEMNVFISKMIVHGRNKGTLLPFQKGIIISNNSLLQLWDELKNNYDKNISYLTTRKFNQDLVENTFSYLKGMCGSASNNITVLDFKYSLRWYILGKHSNCIFTNNTNTECGIETSLLNEDECLTSQIIHNSDIITESYDLIELGEETTLVNKESLDLLEKFEMNVDSDNSFNQIEFQAAKYVAGYVANRYFSKYPQLIDPNGDEFSWIEHVSRGGLKIPSVTLMETAQIMEKEFQKLHGDNLSKITGVMNYLTNILWLKVSSKNIPK
ncbi:Uncharacterized protein FWK35_00030575, partial [Aphis craccivora]